MSESMRAKVLRIIKYLADDSGVTASYGDMADVCDAYLTDHPYDDDFSIDVAWCDGLKGLPVSANGFYFFGHHGMAIDSFRGRLRLWCGGAVVKKNPTRGDVRRLARALKLDLKEGKS